MKILIIFLLSFSVTAFAQRQAVPDATLPPPRRSAPPRSTHCSNAAQTFSYHSASGSNGGPSYFGWVVKYKGDTRSEGRSQPSGINFETTTKIGEITEDEVMYSISSGPVTFGWHGEAFTEYIICKSTI
jgi:hypothetical protein